MVIGMAGSALQEKEHGVQAVDACGPVAADADVEAMGAALKGRSAFYRMISALYFKPFSQEQIDRMAQADFSAYENVNEAFDKGLADIARVLRKRNTGTRQDLAVDFTAAFAGTSSWEGRYAVPYKSVFTSDEGLMYQGGYREVFSAFKQNCVRRRDGLDYPDDHLSFMCEFMAILSDHAESHMRAGEWMKARKDLETSRDFLDAHIMSWFADFSDLAQKILKGRFYRGVLGMTEGFFELDRDVMREMLEEVEARRAA